MTVHLSILVFLPFAAALIGLLLPSTLVRVVAIAGTVLALAYAIVAVADFDSGAAGLQFVTNDRWIPSLGIRWKLGIDGLNLFLILLTCVLWTASTVWASLREWERPQLFFFHMGLAQTAVLGALTAQDLALFVIFFDLYAGPVLLLPDGPWGSFGDRVRATIKLVIYTLVGSLLMLSAAVATGVLSATGDQSVTFEISVLAQRTLPAGRRTGSSCLRRRVPREDAGVPAARVDARRVQAMPMPAVAVFSGVLSKVAAYGFLRIACRCSPTRRCTTRSSCWCRAALDPLRIGHGVLAHASAARARLLVRRPTRLHRAGHLRAARHVDAGRDPAGGDHGLVVVPAFFVVALLAERVGSEDLRELGGLALRAPVLAALALIVTFGVLAMPGSSNFIGEFMILLGDVRLEDRVRPSSPAPASCSPRSTRCGCSSPRSTTTAATSVAESREISLRDSFVLVPLVVADHRAGAVPAARAAPQRALGGRVGRRGAGGLQG